MNLHPVFVALIFFCFLITFTNGSDSPSHLTADVSINCGSTGTFAARNGREWIGDVIKSKLTSLLQIQGSSTISTVNDHHKLISADPIPHKTARVSRSEFSYAFQVKPGQKILRLHFNSATYKGFEGLKDLFTIEAGPFTLLSNFSASLTSDALRVNTFSKEFCLHIRENQLFNVTFSPESSQSLNTYAFINGIEIISVPARLSYFSGEDIIGVQVVGQNSLVSVDQHTALELIHRQNIEQSSVPTSGDFDDMFPTWAMRNSDEVNSIWRIPVNVGFTYMIRLHFSEMGLKIAETGDLIFKVLINEMIAQTNIDIVRERDENNFSWYRDYMVMMRGQKKEGKRELLISLQSYDELIDGHGFITGFEVFKLSNPDNSLASPNPLPPACGSPAKTIQIMFLILGHRNVSSTVALTMVSLVCVIVHKAREYWEANNSKVENKPSARAERLCRRFSLNEIQFATRNFSDALLIGRGGFGKVYKGLIDKGQTTVAVKRLKSSSVQGASEFLMEIETLSELRHVNLVSLIGYCNEHREMILVYDYMASGTLADHLYKLSRQSNNNPSSLAWVQRLNICIGAGRGLDYLHTGHGVIHRDVKTSNILLDENFIAKVSDFGLAKHEDKSNLQSHVSTRVKGTNGYLDPHYLHTRKLTRKSDTYAFGVVLLEILCGRPAVDLSLAEDEHSLTIWAGDKINKGEVDQIVASSLREEISLASLRAFVGIAERCLREDPKNRPTMSQVVLQLEFSLEEQDNKQFLVNEQRNNDIDDSLNTEQNTVTSTHVRNLTPPPEEQTNRQVVNTGFPSLRRDGRKDTTHKPSRLWPWDAFWNRVKPSKKNDLLSEIWEDASIRSTKFDWDMIAAATNQFSAFHKLGEGGFGSVYKGVLLTGQVVAVKRLTLSSTKGLEELKNELLLLPDLQHRNIIKLLGYCIRGEEKLIVYEFMENASLATFIGVQQNGYLQWGLRFEIIKGIARGVVYLHQDSGLRVIHRDLKLSSILLDIEMNPKISDFTIARTLVGNQSDLETLIVGTYWYSPPECLLHGKFSVKSDVYSFGVVILEIVSGRTRMDASYSGPMFLCDYAWELWIEGRAYDLVDESLEGAFTEEEALRCIQVGLLCTQKEPNHRPTMPSVLKMLEGNELLVDPQHPQTFLENLEEICDANTNLANFDRDTVATATNQFSNSNKVGQGRFGPAYKGVLPTGQLVTVKRLSISSTQGLVEFKNEILFLPKLQHRNIIKPLGYCINGEEKFLVYEFVEGITTFIFGEEQGRQRLPWPVRFKIIIGIAEVLVYLHKDPLLSVIFRDLTSRNILLDNEMNPQVSNLGFAGTVAERYSVGISGYKYPEHDMQGKSPVKAAVYSFGIIVLEIVCGRQMHERNWGTTMSLYHAWRLRNMGCALDLVDESIRGELSEDEALRCINVGLLCTQYEPRHRPTMASVLRMLLSDEDLSLKILEAAAHRNEMIYVN